MIHNSIVDPDDKILYQTKPWLNGKLIELIFFLFLLIVNFSFFMWFTSTGLFMISGSHSTIIFYLFLVFFIFSLGSAILLLFILKIIIEYSKLKRIEYFISNKKSVISHIPKNKTDDEGEIYSCLYFNDIDKIIIKPLKLWRKPIAHIDFFSKIILENPAKFASRIHTKGHKITPDKEFSVPKKGEFHRFFYIKDYKELEMILKQKYPSKVRGE